MANDLNLCQFIGRLGKDPEMRYSQDGKPIANFSIACGSSWKDKATGEKKESTEWIRLSAFGKLAEIVGEYLKKGSQVYVSGRMQTRKWQDKEGKDRYTTEIVADTMQMLDRRGSSGDDNAYAQPAETTQSGGGSNKSGDLDDGDIPFLPHERGQVV